MKKILVVEDELIIALDIFKILKNEGFDVKFNITSYEQAVQSINQEKPDLVLIDVKIRGDKDGICLGKYLDELNEPIPYVYITSYTDQITFAKIKKTTPSAFIVKPFTPVTLKTNIALVFSNLEKSDAFHLNNEDLPMQLKYVIDYIEANLKGKVEVSNLHELTNWNQQTFLKFFKQYLKTTPYQYVIKRKIEVAREIMINEEVVLKDLSYELGFLSYSNFFKAFVKYVKQHPEDFMIKNKK